jgi:hypothetical protein
MNGLSPSIEDLRNAIQLACQPSNVGRIIAGRQSVLAFERRWVIQNVEKVAFGSLNLDDGWEYRRFLELLELIEAGAILRQLIAMGIRSSDSDVREAATDFAARSAAK